MNAALVWGLAIVATFTSGVIAAVLRRDGQLTLSRVFTFESVPRYLLQEFRRDRTKALRRLDIRLFLSSFGMLTLLFLIAIGRELASIQ